MGPRTKTGGTASRGVNVFFCIGEIVCAAIVLGLLSRFFYLVDQGGSSDPNARLIYTAVVAGITILWSLLTIVPLAYAFWLFPIDFILLIAWLAAFIALETLTGSNTCNAFWYDAYWGYYWGRWYRVGPVGLDVNWAGCSAWRTVLAFTFIAMFIFLLQFFLGGYTG
ncbi:hypothetical protein B0H63DRAFT_102963 [Podospora didyma]|uniref:MARVEL domain-containing protein n=1 Tax=Podospora didyma TaxID=330526 RepID=A0AAE0U3I9_9PEZI|nr:hypothetical protein B0H63DRAFT_102963 [Podospora didyma]